MKKRKLLIVDDNPDVLFALTVLLERDIEQIRTIGNPQHIPDNIQEFRPDVVLLDMYFEQDTVSGNEGFHWLEQIKELDAELPVVFMTAYADMDKAIRAIKAGAMDFIPKPWEKGKLLATLNAAFALSESKRKVKQLEQEKETLTTLTSTHEELIGESPAMRELKGMIQHISGTDANILILGENGTGKDVVARTLHSLSIRKGKPLVSIDLGSISETLFESELFGHEKGAFTDTKKEKAGRIEIASGGTLFLDEIGNRSYQRHFRCTNKIKFQEGCKYRRNLHRRQRKRHTSRRTDADIHTLLHH